MKKYSAIITCALILVMLLASTFVTGRAKEASPGQRPASPDTPGSRSSYIPVQGRLTDAAGHSLDGSYNLLFSLYDVSSGGTALCTSSMSGVEVDKGLFSTWMNFQGCPAIDGRQLYLGIKVEDDPEMTPRQYIDNVPYAWSLRPGALISGTVGPGAILELQNSDPNGRGLRAYAMSTTGTNYGVVGASRSPGGYGGYFYNNGGGTGLYAFTSSNLDFGVVGLQDSYAVADLDTNWESGGLFGGTNGVVGISHETVRVGAGVFGWAKATTGTSYGVRGDADSTSGRGLYGRATSPTGVTFGVYASSESTSGKGVYGTALATTGVTYGVYGESHATSGAGVYGLGPVGVSGESVSGSGLYGTSDDGYGVYGHSLNSNAIYADTALAGHNYGLYTPDNIYSLNYHLLGAMLQVVQNGGPQPLEAGDVVVFSGIAAPVSGSDSPLITVAKADSPSSAAVAGVVVAGYENGANLPGLVAPGDQLLIVVHGPAHVKISRLGGAVRPGDLLSSSAQPGLAERSVNAPAGAPGTVLGKALEVVESGAQWLWIYVTLQ